MDSCLCPHLRIGLSRAVQMRMVKQVWKAHFSRWRQLRFVLVVLPYCWIKTLVAPLLCMVKQVRKAHFSRWRQFRFALVVSSCCRIETQGEPFACPRSVCLHVVIARVGMTGHDSQRYFGLRSPLDISPPFGRKVRLYQLSKLLRWEFC